MWKKPESEPSKAIKNPQIPPLPQQCNAPKLNAVIGKALSFKGELSGDEDLLIEGSFEGTIEIASGVVTVGGCGHVNARVRARVIYVDGEVAGDLVGLELIVVRSSGRVRGNLLAPRVSLEDGAQIKGTIDTAPGAHAPSAQPSQSQAQHDAETPRSEPSINLNGKGTGCASLPAS